MVQYVRRTKELPILPPLYLHLHPVLIHCLGRVPSILGSYLQRRGRSGRLHLSLPVLLDVPLPPHLPPVLLPPLLHLYPRLPLRLPPTLRGAHPDHHIRDHQNLQ